MTLPRELNLHKEGDDYLIRSEPAKELKKIRTATADIQPDLIKDKLNSLEGIDNDGLLELELLFKNPAEVIINLMLRNNKEEDTNIGYSPEGNICFVDRTFSGKKDFSDNFADFHMAPRFEDGELIKLHLFIDHSSVELFADEGSVSMTEIFFPSENYSELELRTEVNEVELVSGKVHVLRSIW